MPRPVSANRCIESLKLRQEQQGKLHGDGLANLQYFFNMQEEKYWVWWAIGDSNPKPTD